MISAFKKCVYGSKNLSRFDRELMSTFFSPQHPKVAVYVI